MEKHPGAYNVQLSYSGSSQLNFPATQRNIWETSAAMSDPSNVAPTAAMYNNGGEPKANNTTWPNGGVGFNSNRPVATNNFQHFPAPNTSYNQLSPFQQNSVPVVPQKAPNTVTAYSGPNLINLESQRDYYEVPPTRNFNYNSFRPPLEQVSQYYSVPPSTSKTSSGYNSSSNNQPLNTLNQNSSGSFNENQGRHSLQSSYPTISKTSRNQFKNPLNDSTNTEDSDSLKYEMQQAAAKTQSVLEETNRKPNTYAKAALAMLQRDAKRSSKPLSEVPVKLKEFKDQTAHMLSKEKPEKNLGTKSIKPVEVNSSLSIEAKVFVPRNKSPVQVLKRSDGEKFRSRKQSFVDCSSDALSDISMQDVSKRYGGRYLQDIGNTASVSSQLSPSSKSIKSSDLENEMPSLVSSFKRKLSLDVEDKLYWNPLNGPAKNVTRSNSVDSSSVNILSEAMPDRKDKDKCSIDGGDAITQSQHVPKLVGSNQKEYPASNANGSSKQLSNFDALLASPYPCMEDFSFSQIAFPPILGLFSLSCLGFQSEKEYNIELRKKIKLTEDLPRTTAKNVYDSETETVALSLLDECVNQVICNPACFDVILPQLINELRSCQIMPSVINVFVDKIYEMCLLEQNFRYLGSQLLDRLSRTNTGLPQFRSILLLKAQQESQAMVETLKHQPERARNFTHFMAELFLNLQLETDDGLQRLMALAKGFCAVVGKLIDHPDDDNIQCAVRVLKLTVIALEDTLKNNEESMINLTTILDHLDSFHKSKSLRLNKLTTTLLKGFVKLRAEGWGRTDDDYDSAKSRVTEQNPDILSQSDENYFMNEPVFFTSNGVMYTTADAMDPEFYEHHLSNTPFQATSQPNRQQFNDRQNNAPNSLTSASSSAVPYANWSSGETTDGRYTNPSEEETFRSEDYDAEYEAFLKSSGQ